MLKDNPSFHLESNNQYASAQEVGANASADPNTTRAFPATTGVPRATVFSSYDPDEKRAASEDASPKPQLNGPVPKFAQSGGPRGNFAKI